MDNCSYVYFLFNKDKSLIKIGKANNIKQRIVGLVKHGNEVNLKDSFGIELLNEKESFIKESFFHKRYAKFRKKLDAPIDGSTEWFEASILEDLNETLDIIINSSGRKIKTIKKFSFDLAYQQKKIHTEERTKNKISERKLLLPFLIHLQQYNDFSLKSEASSFIKNCLIITPEEMHSPVDRSTSFIDIRIDNIISHKTLEKEDLADFFKVRQKGVLKITEKGIGYIKSQISEDFSIILLSLLVQKDFFAYSSIFNKLKHFFTENEILDLISSDSEFFILIETDEEPFLQITNKGKLYLNEQFRTLN